MIKTLLKIISKEQFGFVDSNDLKVIEEEMPTLLLLMRFGACREVAEASAVKTIISEKEAAGDISTYLARAWLLSKKHWGVF